MFLCLPFKAGKELIIYKSVKAKVTHVELKIETHTRAHTHTCVLSTLVNLQANENINVFMYERQN